LIKTFVIACSALLTSISNGQGQQTNRSPIPVVLLPLPNDYRELHLAHLFSAFRDVAGSDQELDDSDVERQVAFERSASRASLLTAFLTADTNADNVVDADERAAMTRRTRRLANDKFVDWDVDGNGAVTLAEAFDYARKAPILASSSLASVAIQLLALDTDNDGRLTAAELTSLGSDAFNYFDRNRDGVLDDNEIRHLNEYRTRPRSPN
jgi:Ca2+-binding EF-hand superfamily protein